MALPDYVGLTTGAMSGFGNLMSSGMAEKEARARGPEGEQQASPFQKAVAKAMFQIQNTPDIQPEEISSIAKSIHAQYGSPTSPGYEFGGGENKGLGLAGMAEWEAPQWKGPVVEPTQLSGGKISDWEDEDDEGIMTRTRRMRYGDMPMMMEETGGLGGGPPRAPRPLHPAELQGSMPGPMDIPMPVASGAPVQPPRAVVRGAEPGLPGEQMRQPPPDFRGIDTSRMTRNDAAYLDKLAPDLFARSRLASQENQFDVNQGRLNTQAVMGDATKRLGIESKERGQTAKLGFEEQKLAEKTEQAAAKLAQADDHFTKHHKYLYDALASRNAEVQAKLESAFSSKSHDEQVAALKAAQVSAKQAAQALKDSKSEFSKLENNTDMQLLAPGERARGMARISAGFSALQEQADKAQELLDRATDIVTNNKIPGLNPGRPQVQMPSGGAESTSSSTTSSTSRIGPGEAGALPHTMKDTFGRPMNGWYKNGLYARGLLRAVRENGVVRVLSP